MTKNTTPAVTRRGMFALAGASAAVAATPSSAQGFGKGFTHSVASGEPQASSVLLWTRFVADENTILKWQVSEGQDFADVVSAGEVTASASRDYCAKATATGLSPNHWYFYRFIAPSGAVSPVGRSRTLPKGPTANFRMAVFSCANFGFGYFNAYAHAAEANDVDLAVHLGDYITNMGATLTLAKTNATLTAALRPAVRSLRLLTIAYAMPPTAPIQTCNASTKSFP